MGEYGALARRVAVEHEALRQEDGALKALGTGVAATKGTAAAISDELSTQNKLLDDMEAGLGRTHADTASVEQRAAALERDPYTVRNFCALLGPSVVLAVVTFLFVRKLLLG